MKKNVLLVLFAVLAFTLSSCSKDDKDKNNDDELVGSGWSTESNTLGDYYSYSFGLNNKCTEITRYGDKTWAPIFYDLKYQYDKPNLTILGLNGVYATGVIDGEKLTLNKNGKLFIYTKR